MVFQAFILEYIQLYTPHSFTHTSHPPIHTHMLHTHYKVGSSFSPGDPIVEEVSRVREDVELMIRRVLLSRRLAQRLHVCLPEDEAAVLYVSVLLLVQGACLVK